MQKHSTRTNGKSSTPKHGALAPFREQAAPFIRLYFNNATPAFVRDLLSSWYTQLESQTQVFWNRREVAEVALPLMLQEAARLGIDVEAKDGAIYCDAMQEALSINFSRDEHEPRPATVTDEVERDAEAIARLLNSPHFPEHLKDLLANNVLEFTDYHNLSPEVIKTQWTLTVLNPPQEVDL